MKLRDIYTLVKAKLAVRKRRTVVTVSILFGVVLAVLFTSNGLQGVLAKAAQATFGKTVVVRVTPLFVASQSPEAIAKAIDLYNESTDPGKRCPVIPESDPDPHDGFTAPAYLDLDNPLSIEAIALVSIERRQAAESEIVKLAVEYQGEVVATLDTYKIIADTSTDDVSVGLAVVSGDFAVPLIKLAEEKDDVIQVIMPVDQAASLLGITIPTYRTSNYNEFQEYVDVVNQLAIGYQFVGAVTTNDQVSKIMYEIVGLLPPAMSSMHDPYRSATINPIRLLIELNLTHIFSNA